MLCETQLGTPTQSISFVLCSGIRTRVRVFVYFSDTFFQNLQCFFFELEPLMRVKSTQHSYINSV